MAKDYFAEEIEAPQRDYFSEEIESIDKKISNQPFLPQRQSVEEAISRRPDAVEILKERIKPPSNLSDLLNFLTMNPIQRTISAAQTGATALAVPFQRGEAAVAAPALEAQAGNFNLSDLARAAGQGLIGQRPAQLGDLIRTTGFGGRLNEPIAAISGLGGMSALTGGAIRAGQQMAPVAKGVGRTVIESAPTRFMRNVTQNIKNVKNPVQFSQNVRRVLFQQKKAVGDAFEQGIQQLSEANPTKRVDLSDSFKFIKSAVDDVKENPGLASEVKGALRKIRNPELAKTVQNLIDNPEAAKDLTLAQSQEIKNIIQQATSIKGKMGQGGFAQYNPGDLELLDLLDEIKLAQSEAFPEMAQVRKPYAEFIGNYRNVKNMFKPGRLIEKMRKGFGDEEIEMAVKAVLPQDTMKAIQGFRRTGKTIKYGVGAGAALLGLEGGKLGLRKLGITQ